MGAFTILVCSLLMNEPRPVNTATGIRAAVIVQTIAQSADLGTTIYALRSGRARETNPALPGGAGRLTVVKSGWIVASAFGVQYISRRHPRLALISSIALTSLGTWATIHNTRTLRALRR